MRFSTFDLGLPIALRLSRLDFQELYLYNNPFSRCESEKKIAQTKNQSWVTGNAWLFLLAISHSWRNRQHSLTAGLHAYNALIPTFDDLSFTKVESELRNVR